MSAHDPTTTLTSPCVEATTIKSCSADDSCSSGKLALSSCLGQFSVAAPRVWKLESAAHRSSPKGVFQ